MNRYLQQWYLFTDKPYGETFSELKLMLFKFNVFYAHLLLLEYLEYPEYHFWEILKTPRWQGYNILIYKFETTYQNEPVSTVLRFLIKPNERTKLDEVVNTIKRLFKEDIPTLFNFFYLLWELRVFHTPQQLLSLLLISYDPYALPEYTNAMLVYTLKGDARDYLCLDLGIGKGNGFYYYKGYKSKTFNEITKWVALDLIQQTRIKGFLFYHPILENVEGWRIVELTP